VNGGSAFGLALVSGPFGLESMADGKRRQRQQPPESAFAKGFRGKKAVIVLTRVAVVGYNRSCADGGSAC
jgi:hypothetical protein